MTVFIIIGLLLLGSLVAFNFFGKQPFKHRNIDKSRLPEFVKILIRQGNDGGFLVIEIPDTELFVQLAKYEGNESGIQLDFPKAEWSADFYEVLKEVLEKEGIPYGVEKPKEKHELEFISVDLKDNVENSVMLLNLIFDDVFKLSSDQLLNMHFVNVRVS